MRVFGELRTIDAQCDAVAVRLTVGCATRGG